jgi:NTE family protein
MNVALALGGGVALGAYHAGAYAALHEREDLRPARIAGTSVGAVVGALILGNAPEARLAALRKFWDDAAVDVPWLVSNGMNILQTRVFGRPGFFHTAMFRSTVAVYDPTPLLERLARSLDYDRLNRSSFSVTTTDIETGEAVVFDTRRGQRIAPEHLVASCGFLPEFPPLEIDGRLLGDGGLVANTPVGSAIDGDDEEAWTVFALDLFACPSERPKTLLEAAGRRADLIFGNQTRQALRLLELERRLRGRPRDLKVMHLAYRAASHEGGAEKTFNFSRRTLAERWAAGQRDMAEAIGRLRP